MMMMMMMRTNTDFRSRSFDLFPPTPCVLGTVSDRRCVRRNLLHIVNFLKLYFIAAFKKIVSTCRLGLAGMSSLLVVFFRYWDSGWYSVPYFRCRPRVCVFSPQLDDT